MKIQEKIFKAYDIRGIYPEEIDGRTAYSIGLAVANVLSARTAVVGRDMRLSSDEIASMAIQGLRDGGVDVTDIGLISTDGLYFAVGKYGFECGIMITASHNPPKYNGMKICEKEAIPLSGDGKLADVLKPIKDDKLVKASAWRKARKARYSKRLCRARAKLYRYRQDQAVQNRCRCR